MEIGDVDLIYDLSYGLNSCETKMFTEHDPYCNTPDVCVILVHRYVFVRKTQWINFGLHINVYLCTQNKFNI